MQNRGCFQVAALSESQGCKQRMFPGCSTHESFIMLNRGCFQVASLSTFQGCRIEHVSRMQHSGGFQNAKSSMFPGCRMEPASRMQVLRIPGCITDKFPKAKPVAIVNADFPECRTYRAPRMQNFVCFQEWKGTGTSAEKKIYLCSK